MGVKSQQSQGSFSRIVKNMDLYLGKDNHFLHEKIGYYVWRRNMDIVCFEYHLDYECRDDGVVKSLHGRPYNFRYLGEYRSSVKTNMYTQAPRTLSFNYRLKNNISPYGRYYHPIPFRYYYSSGMLHPYAWSQITILWVNWYGEISTTRVGVDLFYYWNKHSGIYLNNAKLWLSQLRDRSECHQLPPDANDWTCGNWINLDLTLGQYRILNCRYQARQFKPYLREAAYYIAEKSGFTKSTEQCWTEAEEQLKDKKISDFK